ncbi:hypothetical protein H0H81_012222 [Sphagnurus paluster]|uniref:Calcium uniporter protein, mitochondrial n=1 Tax=Sphagnurus paluster TaxID=117069 RepID=A0A9P7K5X4_9AGAR|nr:hypothetical protein H0H81_012222 [Sphagnurus paluster]
MHGNSYPKIFPPRAPRFLSTSIDNVNVGHSKFLSEASPSSKWREPEEAGDEFSASFDDIEEGQGKVLPTSSRLFKLVISLGALSSPANQRDKPGPHDSVFKPTPPTIILLHPSQPLSHVGRLISASLSPAVPVVSFRTTSSGGRIYQWSDSTDIGDFIKDAARSCKFSICLTYNPSSSHHVMAQAEGRAVMDDSESQDAGETIIEVEIPTFENRTRYLRRRLVYIQKKLQSMESLKRQCDLEAQQGAKRMAIGGFGMLVVYWGAVARLTFWDYGWDVMEPITYLSGLSTVICGYLWFLYQGREVSYTSVLDRSISARREALYKLRGLDIEQWMDLKAESRGLRKEITRIAEDYDAEDEVKEENAGETANLSTRQGEKLSVQRLKTLQQKKEAQAKATRRDIATLLERGKIETARIKVIRKLDVATPSLELVDAYLHEIAKGYSVDWSPRNNQSDDDSTEGGVKGSVTDAEAKPIAANPEAGSPEETKPDSTVKGDDTPPIEADKRRSKDDLPKPPPYTADKGVKASSSTPEPPEDDFDALYKRFAALKKR